MTNTQTNPKIKKLPSGTELVPPLKAIRECCLHCSEYEMQKVRLCPKSGCSLWAYRFGANPMKNKIAKDLIFEKPKDDQQLLLI